MPDSEKFDLSNPDFFPLDLDISEGWRNQCLPFYRQMILIRELEVRLADLRRRNVIRGPVHLAVGQEAISVGVCCQLTSADYVFGNHRSHGHFIAKGGGLPSLIEEILARPSGASGGRGGSMHLTDDTVGFVGSVPIVAATVPLAVGAAISCKLDKNQCVSVVFVGDGACEEGVFHESLNLARVMNAPVLFVVENNLMSSHMHISQRQPSPSVARFALAHRINHSVIDGNNVLSVASAAQKHLTEMRSFGGPALIEAVTYRWLGHVDWRDDIDVGLQRSSDDLNRWKSRDPIMRLEQAILRSGLISEDQLAAQKQSALTDVASAMKLCGV